jgi:hypothetical protein
MNIPDTTGVPSLYIISRERGKCLDSLLIKHVLYAKGTQNFRLLDWSTEPTTLTLRTKAKKVPPPPPTHNSRRAKAKKVPWLKQTRPARGTKAKKVPPPPRNEHSHARQRQTTTKHTAPQGPVCSFFQMKRNAKLQSKHSFYVIISITLNISKENPVWII